MPQRARAATASTRSASQSPCTARSSRLNSKRYNFNSTFTDDPQRLNVAITYATLKDKAALLIANDLEKAVAPRKAEFKC
ncbi:uncharacterized protein TrAtP1_002730 [Trichoderma atroviride]|uniref:uncharacterized protein n=1 Tax=Hypocrea atroviridis TaxID=63577 RepID=UPI00332B9495|nr:hypothetical protein TrAtP1_002730 [Trichoderma atroviride]